MLHACLSSETSTVDQTVAGVPAMGCDKPTEFKEQNIKTSITNRDRGVCPPLNGEGIAHARPSLHQLVGSQLGSGLPV
jgi:hypothetical protein